MRFPNLASIQGKLGQTDEALKNVVITENSVKELINGDPDNLELVLDIVAVRNDNQKIIVRPGILAEALENLELGFRIGKRIL